MAAVVLLLQITSSRPKPVITGHSRAPLSGRPQLVPRAYLYVYVSAGLRVESVRPIYRGSCKREAGHEIRLLLSATRVRYIGVRNILFVVVSSEVISTQVTDM